MRRLTYGGILRQRVVVAALTLGLLTVAVGIGIELYLSTQRTTLPAGIKQLIEPLNPLIDLKTIETLEKKQYVTVDEARQHLREIITIAESPQGTAEGALLPLVPLPAGEELLPGT